MKKGLEPRRRRNTIVKEVSLVDSPAIQKKFIFYKSDNKEVNKMEKELEFEVTDDEAKAKSKVTDQALSQANEQILSTHNSIKESINSTSKVLQSIANAAGYKMTGKFNKASDEEILEVTQEGEDIDAIVGSFDSAFGESAGMVKGVFQSLSQLIVAMAESVGFTANLQFAKAEGKEPEKPPEDNKPPTPEEEEQAKKDEEERKKKADAEELTDEETALCGELESLKTELEDESLKPERYTELMQRLGVIEHELKRLESKGGDK